MLQTGMASAAMPPGIEVCCRQAGGTGARPLAPIYPLRWGFAALDKQQANGVLGVARATVGMETGVVIALALGSVPFACFGLSRVKLRRLLLAGWAAQAPKRMVLLVAQLLQGRLSAARKRIAAYCLAG